MSHPVLSKADILSNYRQIIDIKIKLPEIIGDLKEFSLSISKLPGK